MGSRHRMPGVLRTTALLRAPRPAPEEAERPARAQTRLEDRMQPFHPSPPGSPGPRAGLGRTGPCLLLLQLRPDDEVMQAAPCTATRVLPPGSAAGRAKLQGLSPPPDKAHYLRTTCSDTLMLRHRKASAAELSWNSFTGGELFKPCLGGLAILKLPGEEGRPKPRRAQLPGGENKPLEG